MAATGGGSGSARFRPGEGDWVCADPKCGNVNFSRRTQCNRCGKDKKDATEIRKGGIEIGKAMAEKSRGLFSADDWQCKTCGNVNWARRTTCNMCNAPKFGKFEERTGFGGGYMERDEVVEYVKRDDSEDEYDEFGRKKKKFRGQVAPPTKTERTSPQAEEEEQEEEEDDDDDDDDDEDVSKYKLDSDDDEEDGDLSKYDLISDDEDKEQKKTSRSRSYSRSSSSRSSSSSSSSSNSAASHSHRKRSRSRSRSRSKKMKRGSSSRSRSGSHDYKSRSRHSRSSSRSRSRSRSRDRHRRRSHRSRSRS